MDLGYIGYGDGIFLEKLDAGPNWQFSWRLDALFVLVNRFIYYLNLIIMNC